MKCLCVCLYIGDGQGNLSHAHVCRLQIDEDKSQCGQAPDFLFLIRLEIFNFFIEYKFSRALQFAKFVGDF